MTPLSLEREAPAVKTDHIMIEKSHLNMSVPQFRYHIVNRQQERVESNLPDRHTAQAVIDHLKLTDPHVEFEIIEEQIYSRESTRLGRDPDLH